jgi:hypothetical protein
MRRKSFLSTGTSKMIFEIFDQRTARNEEFLTTDEHE